MNEVSSFLRTQKMFISPYVRRGPDPLGWTESIEIVVRAERTKSLYQKAEDNER